MLSLGWSIYIQTLGKSLDFITAETIEVRNLVPAYSTDKTGTEIRTAVSWG